MKIITGLLIFSFYFTSCKPSLVRQQFSGADSLVIYFKNEMAGEITKTVQTTEKKAISRIIDFMDRNETELFNCGYDGKMYFFRNGTRFQEVDFKMKDQTCNHFVFLIDDKLVSTALSNEAADFFDALEKGQLFY